MKNFSGIEFCFSKSTFAALGFILPLLLMVYSCLFKSAGFDVPFQLIHRLDRSNMLGGILVIIVFFCSVILLYDIYISMHTFLSAAKDTKAASQKAFFDLAFVIIAILFSIFIVLFHAFDMLGNIPVGRD
ncbi:MAG: hypothetical protein IAE90_05655 [Ignavibacteria bacterium]|nr:hypothetical protein [Ignavibacteria bacterium]